MATSPPLTPISATSFTFESTTPPPLPGNPPAMTRMHTTGNVPQHQNGKEPFDVVNTYRSLLAADPDLTMPVAAIEALVSLLASSSSLNTISETLDLLNTASTTLKRAVANPISLSAGTDLFTRYIITTLRAPSSDPTTPNDFYAIRTHLLNNGRLFAARAKDARRAIARLAARFVREGSTVLTNGGSRVVGAVLRAAAEAQTRAGGAPRFKVVYVTSQAARGRSAGDGSEGAETISALRKLQVPVAEISEAAVAYSLGKVDIALIGAEGVVESGGVISRMGTYQLAVLAKAMGKPLYVVVESHKFVRLFPLGQYDLGVDQKVLDFKTTDESGEGGRDTPMIQGEQTPNVKDMTEYFSQKMVSSTDASLGGPEAVDYTSPDLITALITEAGVLTPSAVSEELIKIWY